VTVSFVFVLGTALVAYNSTAQLIPEFNVLFVPLNLFATLVLAVVALRIGLEPADLGLQRTTLRVGVSWGARVAAVVTVALAVAVAVPALHPLFDDARIEGIELGLLAYRALIRIPLGTALFEEFAFRGVLFGAWARIASRLRAAAGSSLVFGLWHVRPTIDLLKANELAVSSAARASALAAAVLLTAAAGYLFCLLRIHSRSLLAPFVAHAAINSLAIVAAVIVANGT
jgi:membrane protease YdiL (CAAX protease family)